MTSDCPIFFYFSATPVMNLTNVDKKQDLNGVYRVLIFRADQKTKMTTLVSDWLRYVPFLLCNCWTEFDETWQYVVLNALY